MSAGWLGLSNSPPLKMLAGFFFTESQVSLQDNWIFIPFIRWLTRVWCEGPRKAADGVCFFKDSASKLAAGDSDCFACIFPDTGYTNSGWKLNEQLQLRCMLAMERSVIN